MCDRASGQGSVRQHSLRLTSDSHKTKCNKKDRGEAKGVCDVTSPRARPKVIFTLNVDACPIVFSVLEQPHCLSVSNNHCSEK